jgi:integrase
MGRNGKGVVARSDKGIEITFQFKGTRCRETIPLPPTAANLKRAEQHRAAILYEISRGTFDYAQVFPNSKFAKRLARSNPDSSLTGAFFKGWFEVKRLELKASTEVEWNRTVNNMIFPNFGDLRLEQFTREHIVTWLKSLDVDRPKPISNKRLANIQTVIRQALAVAQEKKLITENPLAGYTYTRKINVRVDATDLSQLETKDTVDPFSSEEQALILALAAPQMRNYLQFALWSGLRTSELVALNWSDIDWEAGVVRVWKAMTREAKGKVETTKTAAGRRMVKLLPPALAALNAQKQFTFDGQDAIFCDPRDGKRWAGHGKIFDVWQTIMRKAKRNHGIRYRNPYQTRHTYASMMLSAGEPPMWVSKQMGHADQTMIFRVYGRWMPEADRGVGSRAVAMFAAREP